MSLENVIFCCFFFDILLNDAALNDNQPRRGSNLQHFSAFPVHKMESLARRKQFTQTDLADRHCVTFDPLGNKKPLDSRARNMYTKVNMGNCFHFLLLYSYHCLPKSGRSVTQYQLKSAAKKCKNNVSISFKSIYIHPS